MILFLILRITNFANGVLFSQLGIVGRTGSGKSSLFQVLFRMVNTYEGAVLLDGVNLASVPLDILRLVGTGLCPYDHYTIAEKEFIKPDTKSTTCSGVFLTNSEVFENLFKHCLECLTCLLSRNLH